MLNNIASNSFTVLNNLVLILPPQSNSFCCFNFYLDIGNVIDISQLYNNLLQLCSVLVPIHESIPSEFYSSNMPMHSDPDALVDFSTKENTCVMLLNKVTRLVWSLTRHNNMLVSTKPQINSFINLARTGKVASIRLNCIGIINIAANSHAHDDYAFVFGSVFLQLLNDSSISIISECLNALFDYFSEDGQFFDVINQISLTKSLNEFLPIFTQQITHLAGHCSDKELLSQLKETRQNLARFIKYLKRTYK